MKSKLPVIPVSFLMFLAAAPAVAQKKQPQPKPVLYAVVQVNDEYQVIPKGEVAALKKRLKTEHKAALEAHKQEVKAAKARKEKGKIPAPQAKKLKVIKASLEESAANALVEKLETKAAEKASPRKKPAKKEEPKKAKKEKRGKNED